MGVETTTVALKVSVTCEGCDQPFSYLHSVSGTSSTHLLSSDAWTGRTSDKRATANMMDSLKRGELGVNPCPQCSYVQSWMIPQLKGDRTLRVGVLVGGGVFLVLGYALGWPFPGNTSNSALWNLVRAILTLGGYFFAFILVGALANMAAVRLMPPPNARWLAARGKPTPAARPPVLGRP